MDIVTKTKKNHALTQHPGSSYFSVEGITSFSRSLLVNNRCQRYSIVWLDAGSGKIQLDNRKSIIGPNTIISIGPGQSASITCKKRTTGFAVSFTSDFMESSEDAPGALSNPLSTVNFHAINGVKLNEEDKTFLQSIVQLMAAEAKYHKAFRSGVLKRLLNILFEHLIQNNTLPQDKLVTSSSLFNRFDDSLEQNFTTKRQVSDYANLLRVTASHLNSLTRQITGSTASSYIQQRVLREIKRRAFEQRTTMKEISYALGFNDQSHFSKYFKAVCGKTFTEFRMEMFKKRFQV